MKPFDLEEVLAGKPVRLRSGEKAYVKFQLKNCYSKPDDLIGYTTFENCMYRDEDQLLRWESDGKYLVGQEHKKDIVGMWEDPPKTIKVGNIEFPEPEHKALGIGKPYYYPSLGVEQYYSKAYWADNKADISRLSKGLVHLTKEAATAHAEAIIKISKGHF